jgi:hypothetical protein
MSTARKSLFANLHFTRVHNIDDFPLDPLHIAEAGPRAPKLCGKVQDVSAPKRPRRGGYGDSLAACIAAVR